MALWEESVTQRNNMVTLARGEAAPGREKEGDVASWADSNLTGLKNEENPCGRFSCYKWTVNI
jgi:hypothetical protein